MNDKKQKVVNRAYAHIHDGDIESAISILLEFARENSINNTLLGDFHRELALLSFRYKKIEKNRLEGTSHILHNEIETNKANKFLIDIISRIEKVNLSINSNNIPHPVADFENNIIICIKIDTSFKNFTKEKEDELFLKLKKLLMMDENLEIRQKKSGCVLLSIEMPEKYFKRMQLLFDDGALLDLNIIDIYIQSSLLKKSQNPRPQAINTFASDLLEKNYYLSNPISKPLKHLSDEQLLDALSSSNAALVDNALSFLHHQTFATVSRFVKRYRGTQADAEDTFQDGLVALYKLAATGKLNPDVNFEAYLFSICKNLWFKQLQKNKEGIKLDKVELDLPIEEVQLFSILSKERQTIIENLLNHLGEDCKKILTYYYYDRLRMKRIAELMGYANEQVAKNKKSNCMKKMKEILARNPSLKRKLL